MTRRRYRFVEQVVGARAAVRTRPLDVLVTERFYCRVPMADFWRVGL